MKSYRTMSDSEKAAYTKQSMKEREEYEKCKTKTQRFMFFCSKQEEYSKENPIKK